MNRKDTLPIPEPILQLQCQLDQFRSTQTRRAKLPEPLWQAAVELAELLKPARDELIRQAAQGEVVPNDDTSMRVLRLARAVGRTYGRVYQRDRLDWRGLEDRAVLHWTSACRREHRRRVASAGSGTAIANSDV